MPDAAQPGPEPTPRPSATPSGDPAEHAVGPGQEEPTTEGTGPGLPPPTAIESLVGALLDASPEVAEHVVRAAQELLLAAQAVVGAAERAVEERKALREQDARVEASGAARGAPPTLRPVDTPG